MLPVRQIIFLSLMLRTVEVFAHPCDAALVRDTYVANSSVHKDWRLVTLITEDVYNTLKKDMSADVEVFGVPLGGDYHSFQENVRKFTNSRNESLTVDEAHNLAWTGLGKNAASSYQSCIKASLYGSNGLHADALYADKDAVFIAVRWFVPGQPAAARVEWTPASIAGFKLPKVIPQGDTTIRIPRPKTGAISFSGNYNGYTTGQIVVSELPPPTESHPFRFDLQARGFQPVQSAGKNQVPGCSCGNTGVLLMDNNNNPIAHINAKVGQPANFRWDNGWICQGQGIENYPANVGSINFGNGATNRIPDIWGTANIEYPAPGTYTVTVNTNVHCVDLHCNNSCSGAGSLTVDVQ